MTLEGYKIVTASEMMRGEKISIEAGASDEEYMLTAGAGIAKHIENSISVKKRSKEIVFLAGKGNNGGDAFVAALILKNLGYTLSVYHFFPLEKASPLCQKQAKAFIAAGGNVIYPHSISEVTLFPKGVIIDGLFGTGFQGKLSGLLFDLVSFINQKPIPIIAIDIPSGVNGNTGRVESIAIKAEETLFLGLPKWGFFIEEGRDYLGKIYPVSFGLKKEYLEKMEAKAFLLEEKNLSQHLPPLRQTLHKYEAGYVLALAGSPTMPGAALLSCVAAMRSGAGIVRLFHPKGMEGILSSSPWELIRSPYQDKEITHMLEEQKRAGSWIIGPGIGRERKTERLISQLLPQLNCPAVIDADALFLTNWNKRKLSSPSILTPHRGEMKHLLEKTDLPSENWIDSCQSFCEQIKGTLVVKGMPTFIFHPNVPILIIARGNPGMATAGSGDVLSGILAALLAKGLETRTAAAVGVYLHAIAGEKAASILSSYSLLASDLITQLPPLFLQLLLH